MRLVTLELVEIAEEIVSEVNKKDINSDEEMRQIIKETVKMYRLSFIQSRLVKKLVEKELCIVGAK